MKNKKSQPIHTPSIDFQVNGGRKLHGTIQTNFSKNGSVGLLCASLINKGVTTLHGIARIEEVYRVIEILESIGAKVEWKGKNTVVIAPPKQFNLKNINTDSAVKTRSVVMLIGPMIHFLQSFAIPHPQGCSLGKRTIAAHTYALEKLGVKIKTITSNYEIKAPKLKPAEIVSRGFIAWNDSQELINGLRNRINETAVRANGSLQKDLEQVVSNYIYRETHRRPMVLVNVIKA